MKRRIYLFLFILILLTGFCKQENLWDFFTQSQLDLYHESTLVESNFSFSFGDVIRGQNHTISFSLRNNGVGPCTINSIESSNPVFTLNRSISNPEKLAGGESLDFSITFHPVVLFSQSGVIRVEMDNLTEPVHTFTVTGKGIYLPRGVPDPDFGDEGIAVIDGISGGGTDESAYSMIIDSNTRILVTGNCGSVDGRNMFVYRFNKDGDADPDFAGGPGYFTEGSSGFNYSGKDILLDKNRLIVVGYIQTVNPGDIDLAIWKYDYETLVPDNGFANNGLFTYAPHYDFEQTTFSAVTGSFNDIYASGHSSIAGGFHMDTLHLNSNGALVRSWNTGTLPDPPNTALGFGIAMGNDYLLICGSMREGPGSQNLMTVWKYTLDGKLVTSFGNRNGYYVHNNEGNLLCYANSLAIDEDGYIYIAGLLRDTSNTFRMTTWKLTPGGLPDPGWNTDGVYIDNDNSTDPNYKQDIVLDTAGSVIVCGNIADTGARMAVYRFNEDGDPDSNFAGSGIYREAELSRGNSLAIDINGYVLVAGDKINALSNYDLAIWRFQ